MENNTYPFVNLPLPYEFDALEPFIDTQTMYLHHDRHLQTYIDNLNAALKNQPRLQPLTLEQLIRVSGRLSPELQTPIRNNAGGVYNHRFFFSLLTPYSKGFPACALAEAITVRFGSFDAFRDAFKKAALSVFGSGYAWLVLGRAGLDIVTTANQNSPVAQNLAPILTIDVWEHAYYLKHYNVRADYFDDLMRVIDWQAADQNYRQAAGGRYRRYNLTKKKINMIKIFQNT